MPVTTLFSTCNTRAPYYSYFAPSFSLLPCRLVTFGESGAAERAALAMNGARFGESVLGASVQPASAMHHALGPVPRPVQTPMDRDQIRVPGSVPNDVSAGDQGHQQSGAVGPVGSALAASGALEARWTEW